MVAQDHGLAWLRQHSILCATHLRLSRKAHASMARGNCSGPVHGLANAGWQPLRGAPEAPTEGAGLNRKLAAEPATAEAVYTVRKRGRPLSISTAGPREFRE